MIYTMETYPRVDGVRERVRRKMALAPLQRLEQDVSQRRADASYSLFGPPHTELQPSVRVTPTEIKHPAHT